MRKKSLLLGCFLCALCLSTGCGKSNDVDNTNEINPPVVDENVSGETLVGDFEKVTSMEDISSSAIFSDSEGVEGSTERSFNLSTVDFNDWNFSIDIPKSLTSNYEKVDSLSSIDFSNVDSLSNTYGLESDDTFQLFNLSDKYFGVFVNNEATDDLKQAIKNNDFKTIKALEPDNGLYTYDDVATNTLVYSDNDYMFVANATITPTSDNELAFSGMIGYLVTNDQVYYILYGENSLINENTLDQGYSGMVISSVFINVLSSVDNDSEEIPQLEDNEFIIIDENTANMSDEEFAAYMEEIYGFNSTLSAFDNIVIEEVE